MASAAFAAELMRGARFQLGERQAAGGQRTTLEHQLVAFAIEQDAPVPRGALCGGRLRADARRALSRRGVVLARMRVKFIQGGDVVYEPLARFLRRRRGAVEIDVFAAAKVCPHADHVALISDDVNQLELFGRSRRSPNSSRRVLSAPQWKNRAAARRRSCCVIASSSSPVPCPASSPATSTPTTYSPLGGVASQ